MADFFFLQKAAPLKSYPAFHRSKLVGGIGSGRVRLGERPEKDAQIGRLRKKATLTANKWTDELTALISRIHVFEEEEDLIETGSYWVANERLPTRPVGQRQEEIGVVRLQPETQTIIFSGEKPKKKRTRVEVFDPEVLQKIVYYLGTIDGKGINCPINHHTLVTVFGLAKGEVEKIQEKRWITPARGKDHHPVYSLAEVVTALYCYDNSHGLTKQVARTVQRLTQQEIDKRKKKNRS